MHFIKAGFAVTDITPPIGTAIPGGFSPRESTGVLDQLQARACVVEGVGTETFAIVGVDAVSLRFDTVAEARRRIEAACGIAPRNVVIAANHTHAGGPANDVLGTTSDPDYCALIAARVADAVITAWQRRVPAEAGWGTTLCPGLAFNRRYHMADGTEASQPGKNNPAKKMPAGPADPELGLIAFRQPAGKPLGVIASFTCHCTVIFGTEFSGDYPAYWQQALQQRFGDDFTLVFLNGACGDVTQIDYDNPQNRESGVEWARFMGTALTDKTAGIMHSLSYTAAPPIRTAHGNVKVEYRRPAPEQINTARELLESPAEWKRDKWLARDLLLLAEQIGTSTETNCPIDVFKLGDAVITAAPWQPFCEFGLKIKSASKKQPTLIAAFANGMLGYVPTLQAFKGGGYEPTLCRGSKLQPDAGELITNETIRLIQNIQV